MSNKLLGLLEGITYQNEKNNYTIARFRVENAGVVNIIGYFTGISIGETLLVEGKWETHPKYGKQFNVSSFEIKLPSTKKEIEKYLSNGVIKGIGPKIAKRLVKRFGEETLEIIEQEPNRLLEVEGIGKKSFATILENWRLQNSLRITMQFLQKNGVKGVYSSLILKTYGLDTIDIIKVNPYKLVRDLSDIPFKVIETLAQSLSVLQNDKRRIEGYLLYFLIKEAKRGHTFVYEEELNESALSYLKIDFELLEDVKKEAEKIGYIKIEEAEKNRVFLNTLYIAEKTSAERIKAMLSLEAKKFEVSDKNIVDEILKDFAIKPSSEQIDILKKILSYKVAVITGGPGTGKTTLIKSITTIIQNRGGEILLAAPTGRASRRLSEITRQSALTIHRLLEYNFKTGTFERNRDNQLKADFIIIDEASMIDIELLYYLLLATPIKSTLILVGDTFQLPSIGPGNVLSDIIKSGTVKTFTLTKIFRQSKKSPIVENAHRIREGKNIIFNNDKTNLSEFYFIEQDSPDKVVEIIKELCQRRIKKAFKSIDEIQVLTPMHKGEVGTINLNTILQATLNKSSAYVKVSGREFKMHDKVIHLKNNYEKDIYNGDIGTVCSIDEINEEVTIDYYGREVVYEKEELDELSLAYAISVHKAQGSEYSAVVIPIMEQHYPLLQRNLIYTAITRGKNLVIIVGTTRALEIAIKNKKILKRKTVFKDRLED